MPPVQIVVVSTRNTVLTIKFRPSSSSLDRIAQKMCSALCLGFLPSETTDILRLYISNNFVMLKCREACLDCLHCSEQKPLIQLHSCVLTFEEFRRIVRVVKCNTLAYYLGFEG